MPLPERELYFFIEAAVGHLRKLTDQEIVQQDPTIEFQSLVFSAYTGLLHLSGDADGFVYLTSSQQLLQHLFSPRQSRSRTPEENCRELMSDITSALAVQLRRRFGASLRIGDPQVFSTVPDDPIEMPPAVFVQPLIWRREHAFVVLGLSSPQTD